MRRGVETIGFAILRAKNDDSWPREFKDSDAEPYPLVMAFFYTSYTKISPIRIDTHTKKISRAPCRRRRGVSARARETRQSAPERATEVVDERRRRVRSRRWTRSWERTEAATTTPATTAFAGTGARWTGAADDGRRDERRRGRVRGTGATDGDDDDGERR